jgi:uncharacterized protein YggE
MLNDQVVVYGTASRSVAPDVATLSVSVKEVDADPGAAFERCVPRLNEVVGRLSELVGGDGQVTTGNVGVHRHYELEEEGPRVVHAASGEVAVECPPALAAQVMAQSALKADEFSLRYSVRDPAQVREDLLAVAVSTARRKAERLAQAAERSLGAVVGVEERSTSDIWQDDQGGIELRSGPAEVELQPADVTVAVSVRVAFALR